MRPFGKKEWDYPSFSPERLQTLIVNQARVIFWKDVDSQMGPFDLSINVLPTILRNESGLRGFLLSKRMSVCFEKTAHRRFFLQHAVVVESTITIRIAWAPDHERRFKLGETIRLASRYEAFKDSLLYVKNYEFSVTDPKPKPEDLPF